MVPLVHYQFQAIAGPFQEIPGPFRFRSDSRTVSAIPGPKSEEKLRFPEDRFRNGPFFRFQMLPLVYYQF